MKTTAWTEHGSVVPAQIRRRGSTRAKTVSVCGVEVADLSAEAVVDLAAKPAIDLPRLVYALHVGGLNAMCDLDYRRALLDADLVYADGAAIVALARMGGAQRIERAATTDIGIPVLARLTERLGRPVRVALVGGPAGLTERAAAALRDAVDAEVVLTSHGYLSAAEDRALVADLWRARPDVLLVGLGCPREAIWAQQHRHVLPPCLVLTCGGWFGFLAGEEERAPEAMRNHGMEWLYRLTHDFTRLRHRYALGMVLLASAVPGQLAHRRAQLAATTGDAR